MEDSIPAGLNHLVLIEVHFYFILRKLSLCERRFHIFLGRRGRENLRRLGILCILRIYLPISAFTCLLLRSLGNFDKELVQGKVVADGVLKYSSFILYLSQLFNRYYGPEIYKKKNTS